MGLFGGKKLNRKVQNVTSFGNEPAEQFLIALYKEVENEALKLSAVYSAISTISNTMSKIPFSVINRFTKEEIKEANLYNILNLQPTPTMNASDFYKMLATWTLYEGEAFYVPIRKFRSTQIEKLVPVRKSQVTKDIDENGTLHYNVTFDNKVKQRYRFDEIVHLKEFTLNGVDGLSPLEYARHTVQTGLNQMVFEKSFYANYGRPNDYLKTATDLSSKKVKLPTKNEKGEVVEIERSLKDIMREEWAKAHSGDRLYSTAILDNGLEYGTVPQITPEQMQFVSAKAVTVEDIARFFDMANCLHKLGMGKQTYSTNEQGQISYVTETIVPRLRRWEQEFTLKLLTEEQRRNGWVIKGNINAELRGDTSARATWYEKMQQMGAYTINTILELEDMPNIGEEGDVRLIGPNKTPLEVLVKGGTPADVTPNVESKPTEEKVEPTEEKVEEKNNKRRKP